MEWIEKRATVWMMQDERCYATIMHFDGVGPWIWAVHDAKTDGLIAKGEGVDYYDAESDAEEAIDAAED